VLRNNIVRRSFCRAGWPAHERRRQFSGDLRVGHVFGMCAQATCRRHEQHDGRRESGQAGVKRWPDRQEPTDHADARTADDLTTRVERLLRRRSRCPYAPGRPARPSSRSAAARRLAAESSSPARERYVDAGRWIAGVVGGVSVGVKTAAT
jgi:hypothetical protein